MTTRKNEQHSAEWCLSKELAKSNRRRLAASIVLAVGLVLSLVTNLIQAKRA